MQIISYRESLNQIKRDLLNPFYFNLFEIKLRLSVIQTVCQDEVFQGNRTLERIL